MPSLTLILGGARSGKSRFGEQCALSRSPTPVYIATSRAWDDDHRARIARHQAERSKVWKTYEEEKEPSRLDLKNRVILLDCVTLWLTNHLFDEKDAEQALENAKAEATRFLAQENEWFLVSNEIGLSLHAETELGRKFTDMQGFMNQFLAARAERVVLMVAGIPVTIKGQPLGAAQ